MKKYLQIRVTRHDDTFFSSPLKLSEAHLVSKLAQENKRLEINIRAVSKKDYDFIFN